MYKIGIELNEPFIKLAKLSQKKKTITIDLLSTTGLLDDTNVKPLYLSSLQPESLVSGLDAIEVLFREIELPTREKRKILKLLPFQIESQLPYSLEEAVIGLQLFLDPKEKKGKASIFSVRGPSLEAHIERHTQQGLELGQVSCIPAALCRFFHFFFPNMPQAILLHVGEQTSVAIYLEAGRIVFSHTFPIGVDRFSSQETLPQAEKELDRIFAFLEKKTPDSCSSLIITGDFSKLPGFSEFLVSKLPPSLQIQPFPLYEPYDTAILQSYAISIGLALEGLLQDEKSFSFCQGPFSTGFMKEKKKKKFLSFATAALALACTVFIMGNIYLEQRKHQLIKGFSFILPKERKAIHNIEDLEKELSFLEAKEHKDQKNYSIAPSVANVSETLAFLSAHPAFSKDIEITKIEYQLVKYPKASSPKSPYIGKVDIELLIENPKSAVVFYEKFCQNNTFINTKKEILWKETGSTYSLSFFLNSFKESSF
ncbi:MAG: hypothetical protein V4489_05910 [Chlamydiota bacterium]